MSENGRPRVLVAVHPRLLGSVIAGLLRRADLDDVIEPDDASELVGSPVDVAIVTKPRSDGVRAKLLVQLDPDRGTLVVLDGAVTVRRGPLAGPLPLIGLIDELCPAAGGSRRAAVDGFESRRPGPT